MNKVKVGIIGASGYAGAELVRLLLNHPKAEISAINARSYLGKPISSLYQGLRNVCDMTFTSEDEVIEKATSCSLPTSWGK